jgi:hypothetical protein
MNISMWTKVVLIGASITLPSMAIGDYLQLPDDTFYRLPEESKTRKDVPYWECFVAMKHPELYKKEMPEKCGRFSLELAKKYGKVKINLVALPNNDWFQPSPKQALGEAMCAAYIEKPDAFRSVRNQMGQFNCQLPATRKIADAVDDSTSWLDGKLNSLRGLNSGEACLTKYKDNIRLSDAINLLQQACYYGYERGALNDIDIRDDLQNASRCVASKTNQFYSFDSTLSALNSCTSRLKNGASIFDSFKYALYEQKRAEQEAGQARRDAALAAQIRRNAFDDALLRAPLDLPRLPMICHNMGGFLTCD